MSGHRPLLLGSPPVFGAQSTSGATFPSKHALVISSLDCVMFLPISLSSQAAKEVKIKIFWKSFWSFFYWLRPLPLIWRLLLLTLSESLIEHLIEARMDTVLRIGILNRFEVVLVHLDHFPSTFPL